MDIFLLLVLIIFGFVISSKVSDVQRKVELLLKKREVTSSDHVRHEQPKAVTHGSPAMEQKTEVPTSQSRPSGVDKEKYAYAVAYIQNKIDSGVAIEDISRGLSQVGWTEEDIGNALALAKREISHEVAGTPVATSSSHSENSPKGENQSIEEYDPFTPFFHWLATDWLMKVGAFLILLAFGWFVSYAFVNDWVGPVGRIVTGIVIGILILLLGEWRIKAFKNQGAVLQALGSAGILITIYVARGADYDLFNAMTALSLMFLVVVYLGLSSVRYRSKALAVLALVLGFLIPLLTQSQFEITELFMYLLVVSVGVLWVAGVTGWRPLIPVSLIGMFFYSFSAFDVGDTEGLLFLLALVFAGVYFVTGMIAIVKSKQAYMSDLITAMGVGIFALMWIMVHMERTWWTLSIVALALVFSVGAFMVYSLTSMKDPFYLYGGVALSLIGIATALELHDDLPALTIVATLEIVLVVALIKTVLQDTRLAQYASLLLCIPGVLSLPSIFSSAWNDGILHGDFAALLVMMVTLASLGAYFYERQKRGEALSEFGTQSLFVFSALYALALVWLVPYALFDDDPAIMVILIIHTIVGLYFYLTGSLGNNRSFKTIGVVFLVFVIGHLLLVEIRELGLVGKVVVFSLIGLLLMSTAFIGRSKK